MGTLYPKDAIDQLVSYPTQSNRNVLLSVIRCYLSDVREAYEEYVEKISSIPPDLRPSLQEIIDEYEYAQMICEDYGG